MVGFLIGSVMMLQDWKRFQHELGEKALILAESVAISAPTAMLRKDYWSLYTTLRNMAAKRSDNQGRHEIINAMILDAEGHVMSHLNPSKNPINLIFTPGDSIEENLFKHAMKARKERVLSSEGFSADGFQEGVVPIFSDQKYMGVVRVRLSVAQLYEKAKKSLLIITGLVICFVIIGSALGTYVSKRMVEPLTAITLGLEAVGRGEVANIDPVAIKDRDEIGRLSVTFNQIMTELAEKKMLEEQMAISEKLVALGRITAGVAHEVNNPLAGLLNCIDTLRKHPDDKQLIDRYLPVIDQGLHRIKDIVHNLLVGLKIEESEEIVNISHIDKIQDLISAEIMDRDINIIWENTTHNDISIPGKTEQIICNLLKNSVDALNDGGTITFNMYEGGNMLIFEVSDNGPGIPADIRSQLFDPFFTTKTNGTGLGLWIVYRLVDSMQGLIEVSSEMDQGTTFHIEIPVISQKVA